jgi:hypothetical protein
VRANVWRLFSALGVNLAAVPEALSPGFINEGEDVACGVFNPVELATVRSLRPTAVEPV